MVPKEDSAELDWSIEYYFKPKTIAVWFAAFLILLDCLNICWNRKALIFLLSVVELISCLAILATLVLEKPLLYAPSIVVSFVSALLYGWSACVFSILLFFGDQMKMNFNAYFGELLGVGVNDYMKSPLESRLFG
uniref:Uncharacterized protein n=1 Tax=Ditylenchus dipsaci TaxID=166011 RepID=A0A915EQA7_9BILA